MLVVSVAYMLASSAPWRMPRKMASGHDGVRTLRLERIAGGAIAGDNFSAESVLA